jgi:hypothetical protein
MITKTVIRQATALAEFLLRPQADAQIGAAISRFAGNGLLVSILRSA